VPSAYSDTSTDSLTSLNGVSAPKIALNAGRQSAPALTRRTLSAPPLRGGLSTIGSRSRPVSRSHVATSRGSLKHRWRRCGTPAASSARHLVLVAPRGRQLAAVAAAGRDEVDERVGELDAALGTGDDVLGLVRTQLGGEPFEVAVEDVDVVEALRVPRAAGGRRHGGAHDRHRGAAGVAERLRVASPVEIGSTMTA
jgi:hypothetical protein